MPVMEQFRQRGELAELCFDAALQPQLQQLGVAEFLQNFGCRPADGDL